MSKSNQGRRPPEVTRYDSTPELADTGPAIALLSNGRYSVMVTDAGAGCAIWRSLDVTRWREDVTRDCWGQFCYVREQAEKTVWSIGKQPVCRPANSYAHSFHGDRAEFSCRSEDIEISWKVCVAQDADAEVRELTVVNHGGRERTLDLTSYSEVCLNDRRADRAHPAFAKLFVETHHDDATGALFARRRPRDAAEPPVWAVHVSSSDQQIRAEVAHETDRLKFLGRGRTTADPAMLDPGAMLSKSTGPVLDAIFCLQRIVHLKPKGKVRAAFVTGATDNQQAAQEIAERYSTIEAADRAFSEALEAYRGELQSSNLTADDVSLFNQLAGSILFANPAMRLAGALKKNPLDRGVLWSHGISGDLPIMLVCVNGDGDAALIREVRMAHDFARRRGLLFDLALYDRRGARSAERLAEVLRAGPQAGMPGKPGGIFVLSAATAPSDHLNAITAAARIVLPDGGKSLASLLDRQSPAASLPARIRAAQTGGEPPEPGSTTSTKDLLYWNGFGGFTPGGREYVVMVDGIKSRAPALPPAPWSNVLANPDFGCLTTEAGLGYTWWGNSQMNRLTPWSNDPVSDTPGEVIYLRDEESGDVWTPTPLPLGHETSVTVHHGQGYSRYVSRSRRLSHELTVHVPPEDPVKVMHLRLSNDDARTRHLTATYFAEWVLGTQRDDTAMQIVCERDAKSNAIIARNPWVGEFAKRLAFAAASQPPRSMTSDRAEFLGKHGSVSSPAALGRSDLAESFGPLQDPCAALMVEISLAPGESKEVTLVLGQARTREQVRRLVRDYADPQRAIESFAATCCQWNDILDTIQVSTPDVGMNLMMNRWLPYQVLACRVWGRSGFYQSGGAFGFRDQLQDVMALVHSAPDETRAHILRAAARQFAEGDVQHWWHPPSGVGVRTRITDDLYFLPFVVHHYVSTTGDVDLLDEQVSFITSPVLKEGQEEDFGKPDVGERTDTLYEHCIRALEYGFRLGQHGLPLMGTGDWNDGMNKVGAEGRGESVWNGWFFLTVLKSFATIASSRGDESRETWCCERAEGLRAALEAHAWDGSWYRRAYFDDGTPLGSSSNDECQIDALPQAWAVISGEADEERASKAMSAAYQRLVRRQDKLIQLFDPPFDKGSLQPGYIKGYVPGIRENGGQYTHAAAWVVLATALQGDGERALELWNLLNPINHAATKQEAQHYRVEPYVVSADVYGAPPNTGRGGWTWYTGAAGWLYRVALEAMLGFRRQAQFLSIEPCVPADWPEFEIKYRHGSSTYRIHVDNPAGVCRGVRSILLDDTPLADTKVPLTDDGRFHDVRVILG
ncbi:glycosyl transferase [Sinorhizobium medicae]|nr:glycosyl transferase [Sinorhizobium medicae]MDX1227137.1 glycosyl transferase [Sinorhizobium medicae]